MTGAVTELIGWVAATVLLATMGRQVYTQWRDGNSKGVSKWLFIVNWPPHWVSSCIAGAWELGVRRDQRVDAADSGSRPMDLTRQ